MTIYLDISAAVHRRAGLGRYAEGLARALAPLLPGRLALFYNREQGIEPLAGLPVLADGPGEHIPSRTVALGYKLWRMLVWAGQLAHVGFNRLVPGAELFHATEHLLMPLRNVPTVLTVHDLVFRHLPKQHKPLNRWYLNLTLPLYCWRATHIIAVSEHTRYDLITSYDLPPEKITVIYEGVDARFRPVTDPEAQAASRARHGLPERFILYVGTIEPRKNLTALLEAFHHLLAPSPLPLAPCPLHLVIVGKKGWLYEGFFRRLRELGLEDRVHFTGYVPDEDLPALYSAADLFVFPSLYEGFGLPVLEAMACGVPVVTSSTSSLPEVVGEAGLLVDPHDVGALVEAMGRALTDRHLRLEMKARGLERARRFTWEKAARETLAVYEAVLEKRVLP